MSARIDPAPSPLNQAIQSRLDQIMPPGAEPLVLFMTLARDQRLFERFIGGGLLDPGHLTLRQREIVIDRVTAKCRSEYEWGVHVAFFAKAAGLNAAALIALQYGQADAACWSSDESMLIRLCDSLAATCDADDALWDELARAFTPEAIMELLLLAGFYRTVSYLTNVLRLPLEPGAARFSENTAPIPL